MKKLGESSFVSCAQFMSKFICGCFRATARAARSVTSYQKNRIHLIGRLLRPAFLTAGAAAAADT